MSLKAIKNVDKVIQAVEAIQEFIIGEKLPVGADLPSESEMAKQIGVSKFSMREALRVLQMQGIIEITRGRRSRVAKQTVAPIIDMISLTLKRTPSILEDLMEARKIFDVKIAGMAALKATEKDIRKIENIIDKQEQHKSNLAYCIEKDIEFHKALVEIVDNKVLEIMITPISELLREQQERNKRYRKMDAIIKDHRKILSSIAAKKPADAEQSMLAHLKHAEADLKKSFKNS